ncbi:hypothetical protein [Wielerella bovis]|uniref:hypothetical protein n=1 Tax=Wielerella bovis TaxID=2917790 RepID=UPI002018B3C2|nr:hypothetical protein [Wielerella bovis]ULJ67888.1 hypothetical protein MIS31_04930 [Wielerella bovis]
MKTLDQVKTEFPQCHQIIGLLEHLHSDCAAPEQATYKTLEWLAGVIQNNAPIHTHLAFSDGQATGKSLFSKTILNNIFWRQCCSVKMNELENRLIIQRLNFFEIQSIKPIQEMYGAIGYADPKKAFIFTTNQYIKPQSSNRSFRIARCSMPLDDTLYKAVINEIKNSGLMQFADLLHTIDGSTASLPNLNAIY